MRYTPASKNSAVTNLTSPNTGSVASKVALDRGGAPKNMDAVAVPAASRSPNPRIRPPRVVVVLIQIWLVKVFRAISVP